MQEICEGIEREREPCGLIWRRYSGQLVLELLLLAFCLNYKFFHFTEPLFELSLGLFKLTSSGLINFKSVSVWLVPKKKSECAIYCPRDQYLQILQFSFNCLFSFSIELLLAYKAFKLLSYWRNLCSSLLFTINNRKEMSLEAALFVYQCINYGAGDKMKTYSREYSSICSSESVSFSSPSLFLM